MIKSKELKTKISHTHSLILSYPEIKGTQDQDLFSCTFCDSSFTLCDLPSLSSYSQLVCQELAFAEPQGREKKSVIQESLEFETS